MTLPTKPTKEKPHLEYYNRQKSMMKFFDITGFTDILTIE